MGRIIVCDDAKFMRMMVKDICEATNHEVVAECGNGGECFEKYKELKPDLVLMDITMPEIDGLQGLKMIREFDPKAKVVMCSAMGQQAMVVEAIQSGALDFIVKPFNKDRITECIKKNIG